MFVCVCKAVRTAQIVEAVENGARTLSDLRRDLGVASECGACAPCALEILRQTLSTLGDPDPDSESENPA